MAAAAWDATREQNLKAGSSNKGDVLYWMARDQRAADNWALLRAAALAKENGGKARVVFALSPITTERRLDFQLKGLVETGRDGRETITPLGWAAVGLSAALPLAIVSALSAAQRQTAQQQQRTASQPAAQQQAA